MSLSHQVLGEPPNHWHHVTESSTSSVTFDLTRSPPSVYHPADPRKSVSIKTLPLPPNEPPKVTIDPRLSALIIIDMQNFFLSPALGRDPAGAGHQAMAVLEDLVPRCRDAGIRVIWCNWGMTEQDLGELPPAVAKGFGSLNKSKPATPQANIEGEPLVDTKPARIYKGFGTPMGTVDIAGEEIDAGRLLMRDQWNSALPPALENVHDTDHDVWVDKNRMSGMWNANTPLYKHLEQEGLRTLLFAGVNTDQCVQGTLVDAYNSGWDCLMVTDACGTGTPKGRDVTEWNVGRSWGFLLDSHALREGLDSMHLR